eukprot:TRINITY_DN13615_c1_g1_i2.p1 TRINITY_DN13615_c1_g1~~TRINITY_DN13615_c1_g1_i2.p1  ORF type:complete len:214 (-),score=57.18 TRINITY_DN13615_c1_g1_i2:241-882(-)
MSGEYLESEFYTESSYTADISNKMRVPDRLFAHNGHSEEEGRLKDQEQFSINNMHVPDRIVIGGGNEHIPGKSTPRELQLEKAVVPPTPEHVRVNTPPRSIKLDEVAFPSAGDTPVQQSPPSFPKQTVKVKKSYKEERSLSFDQDQSLMTPTADSNMSLYDEVQRMRTQMAKLNHRLMALELENQSQHTRWQMLSVMVLAYFGVKALAWLNKY